MEIDSLVSILIPNYNKAVYLRETLNSVLSQSYQNWECLVVDDISTDDSWAILSEYSKKDERFRVFKRPEYLPKGGNVCRNFALEKAKGRYCIFLDSDDVLEKNCLERRIEYLNSNAGLDFLVFNVELFKDTPGDLKILWNVTTEDSDIDRFLKTDGVWQTSGPIYSVAFLKGILGFDENIQIWQDFELHFRAVLYSNSYQKFLDLDPDVFIRSGQSSLSNRSSYFGKKKVLLQRITVYFKMLDAYLSFDNSIKQNEVVIYSIIFSLTSSVFLKYGNWSKFHFYWKQAKNKGLISSSQYLYGIIACLILKFANRFPPVIPFLSSFKVFPNFDILKDNKMAQISRGEI